jgi:segregation and condensation protein A
VAEQEVIEAGAHAYRVSLPEGGFEGPLDLLLHLCQKHELDILNIPISLVTEKYLEYLAVMTLMNLDLAAEYLVMAATLAHIKSKMLLPAPPPGQEDSESTLEEIDPREALIRRLLEYQKYKKAGEELTARGVTGRDVFLRGVDVAEAVQVGEPPLAEIPLYRLVEAFQAVLQKAKVKISHDIVADRISITDRIHELTALLRDKKRLLFEDLFRDLTTRFDLVITFLAILEMAKLRMARLMQVDPFSPLYIEVTMRWEDDDDGADRPLPSDISGPQDQFQAASVGHTTPSPPQEPNEDGLEASGGLLDDSATQEPEPELLAGDAANLGERAPSGPTLPSEPLVETDDTVHDESALSGTAEGAEAQYPDGTIPSGPLHEYEEAALAEPSEPAVTTEPLLVAPATQVPASEGALSPPSEPQSQPLPEPHTSLDEASDATKSAPDSDDQAEDKP